MNSEIDRIEYLDTIKGFCTILVVLGHIADGYYSAEMFPDNMNTLKNIFNSIYLFHMPLYFILSGCVFGFVYASKGLKTSKVMRQIGNLLWSYTLWSIIFGGFKILFSGNVNGEMNWIDIVLIPLVAISPYWYLYVLIVIYFIMLVVNRCKISNRILMIVSGMLCLIQFYIVMLGEFTILHVSSYMFFFVLGLYISQRNADKVVSVIENIILGIIGVIGFMYVIAIRSDCCNWTNIPIIGGIFAFCISIIVIEFFRKYAECKLFSWMQVIGRYALEVYVMHCFITAGNRVILLRIGIRTLSMSIVVNCVMAVGIPILCSWCLKKMNIRNMNLHTLLFRPCKILGKEK